MKVLLQSIGGTQFPVEVGDSGTLQELKEKVHETLDIPIARQILILSFNGNILREDTDIVDVKHGSVIKFRIDAEFPDPDPEPEAEVMDILIRLEISPTETISVKTCDDDTVYELKKKIQKKEGTPADQIVLTTRDGTELGDYERVRDCDWESGVEFEFLAVPDVDLLRLELQFKGEKLPAKVEVWKWEMVKVLRAKLDAMEFKAPGNVDYCFFHGEDLLDENSSFASHKIANGGLIRITTGYACYLRRYVA